MGVDSLLAEALEKAEGIVGEIDAALTMSVDKYGHAEFPRRDAIARAILEARAKVLENAAYIMLTSGDSQRLRELAALYREVAGRINVQGSN